MNLRKPNLESVPLATGLKWSGAGAGFLFQEKSDGRHEFAEVRIGASVEGRVIVNAERMRDGRLIVNDLLTFDGADLRREETAVRWGLLLETFQDVCFQDGQKIELARTGNGGEFLEAILAAGGEGVVAKPWHAPFGVSWYKCKRSQVYYCAVRELFPDTGSVGLALAERATDGRWQMADGRTCGRLALHGRFESVRVGSVLKVEAFGLTAKGQLREARLDRDTPQSWLAQM